MRKTTNFSIFFSLVLFLAGSTCVQADDYTLEQALVVSRHNLRTPFTWSSSTLTNSTPNSWPKWDNRGNELTTKGSALEVYMGYYFNAWLQKTGLLPEVGCPDKNSVYIYANRRQRTVATARFFTAGAFPACDIPVQYQPLPEKDTWESMDPVFNYVITNKSNAFKEITLNAMDDTLKSLNLAPSYRLLEEVVDYKNSNACIKEKKCSLTDVTNIFTADPGSDPSISGPLKVSSSLVDALMMEYYEGFPVDQITWGKVLTPEQWEQLILLRTSHDKVQFSSSVVSQNLAKPLVSYIRNALINTPIEKAPKLTVLVGHDTNIATLLYALEVNDYQLPHQYETFPIGGKVVFQRWKDKNSNQDLLKVEYIYQSTEQIRNATRLTLDNPPQHVTLSLKGCPVDKQGFCPWSAFEKILKEAAK